MNHAFEPDMLQKIWQFSDILLLMYCAMTKLLRLKAGRNMDYLEQVLLGELEKMNLN